VSVNDTIPPEKQGLLQEHRKRLRFKWPTDPDYYSRLFNGEPLTRREAGILGRYGAWMRALAEGKIEPLTEAQTGFVEACRGQRPAATEFEAAYLKFQNMRPAHRHVWAELEDWEPTEWDIRVAQGYPDDGDDGWDGIDYYFYELGYGNLASYDAYLDGTD